MTKTHGSGYDHFCKAVGDESVKRRQARLEAGADKWRILDHPEPDHVAAAMVQDDRGSDSQRHSFVIVPDKERALKIAQGSFFVAIIEENPDKIRDIARAVYQSRRSTEGLTYLQPNGRFLQFKPTPDTQAHAAQMGLFH